MLDQPARWRTLGMILVGVVAADQATKAWANAALQFAPPHSWLGDVFRLQYALNPGGFLGLGGDLSPAMRAGVFIGLNAVGLLALLAVLWRCPLSWRTFVAGCLILAGGVGNQIDRCLYQGLVVDFLNLGLGGVRTGIFNVADVAISLGAVVWMVVACSKSPEAAEVRPLVVSRS